MTKAEQVVEILKRYATKRGVIVRSTSDLSPLEEWLLMQLITSTDRAISYFEGSSM